MNHKSIHQVLKVKFSAIIALLFLVGCSESYIPDVSSHHGHIQSRAVDNNSFDFPIRPGDPEWSNFESHDEMVAASNLPDSILKDCTSEQLVAYLVKYPLIIDAFFYNSLEEGIQHLSSQFNGLEELLQRDDNAEVIINYLENHISYQVQSDPLTNAKTDSELGEIVLSRLLSFDEINKNINPELSDRINLLNSYNPITPAIEITPGDTYIKTGYIFTPLGTSWGYGPNNNIYNPPSREEFQKAYPNSTIIGDYTKTYNCHAYAWYMSEGNVLKCWLNPKKDLPVGHIPHITDGSFLSTTTGAADAVKICYFDNNGSPLHSANYFPETGYAESKWGASYLVRHPVKQCPYQTNNIKYYKRALKIDGPNHIEKINGKATATYSIKPCAADAKVTWSVNPASAQWQVSADTHSITVTSPIDIILSADYSVNGCRSIVQNKHITVWGGLCVTDIVMFQYGQTGYTYSLQAKYEGVEIADGQWSCSDPNVQFSEIQYPDDITYDKPYSFFKAVTFPGPGKYDITVCPQTDEMTGMPFTKTFTVPIN